VIAFYVLSDFTLADGMEILLPQHGWYRAIPTVLPLAARKPTATRTCPLIQRFQTDLVLNARNLDLSGPRIISLPETPFSRTPTQ
jgi:hypothetical protein